MQYGLFVSNSATGYIGGALAVNADDGEWVHLDDARLPIAYQAAHEAGLSAMQIALGGAMVANAGDADDWEYLPVPK